MLLRGTRRVAKGADPWYHSERMPRRDDLRKIMLVGSGPIVIGQACEFDYSGTQGAQALKEEGYEVVLVNSNPATIMTDPGVADRTYVEPLQPEVLEAIIERERPDALLPTLGGQTALNLALELAERGVLERYQVELIGARLDAIRKAEDRALFKAAMERIGLQCPRAFVARSLEAGREAVESIGFPIILRPSFTMGGSGGGIAYNAEEFEQKLLWALKQSPTHECLIEESVLGWKEFELEVIRDPADNFIVVCTIENIDAMGVHTGDSVTVAPAMTLTDREFQRLRNAAKAVLIEIGVDTGGSNVQFALNPTDGRIVVIEMNPRVSRSSALASKATGYPIARIAAKLAVGYRLDELRNPITGTSAAFEPAIDYVVTKAPRFAFEKFEGTDPRLGTQMKSVGEAMSLGRTFRESFQKALRSLELGRDGLVSLEARMDYLKLAEAVRASRLRGTPLSLKSCLRLPADLQGFSLAPQSGGTPDTGGERQPDPEELKAAFAEILATPLADRLWYLGDALRAGMSQSDIVRVSGIDPWFVAEFGAIIAIERAIQRESTSVVRNARLLREARQSGFSRRHVARLSGCSEAEVLTAEREAGIEQGYLAVDSCAAEFPATTPYFYGTFSGESEAAPPGDLKESSPQTVVILGGGPNRIGQGIEFDYCCVHACQAFREAGLRTVMINCNPETVSTDFDTSDRLYFEPLTFESVQRICEVERPIGVVVQFGGQTPIRLARELERAGIPLLGTSADATDRAEDRERFEALLEKLQLKRPQGAIAKGSEDALRVAETLGFPVLVRPSYVLGGRAMEVVTSVAELTRYLGDAFAELEEVTSPTVLVDKFLEHATEVDVDVVCDGTDVFIGGIQQHIEEAGIHSGDSALVFPAHDLSPAVTEALSSAAEALALELGVIGLMNVQFAVLDEVVYVIEVNPRASRTVPFLSKASGVPLAKIAAWVMAGRKLKDIPEARPTQMKCVTVKESVFPFIKFQGSDALLGPEMRSTGEVMGIGKTFPEAFLKAMLGVSAVIPETGTVLMSVRDEDKRLASALGVRLQRLGFSIAATAGTADALRAEGVSASQVNKVAQGRPNIVDGLHNGSFHLVINTTAGREAIRDSRELRRQTLLSGVPYFTTIQGASAAVAALETRKQPLSVVSLQELHRT